MMTNCIEETNKQEDRDAVIEQAASEFKKKLLVLRSQLIGAEYFNALSALEYAMKHHNGFRKNGYTPEFQHQVEIAMFAMTLPNLMDREAVIATIMLHDVREDFGVSPQEVFDLFDDVTFAEKVSNAVDAMTKKFRGVYRTQADVFSRIAADPIASIAKGCDRIHNYNSMMGVFGIDKQKQYIQEGTEWFLPMLKTARRNFPKQVNAYENIKFVLQTQMSLVRATWP